MPRQYRLKPMALALMLAACQTVPAGVTAYAPASPQAQRAIDQYLADVDGRFGALAITDDGSRTASYICHLRSWKNCDNYELNDYTSIPSGRIAATIALSRCGSGCRVLYINDKRQSG
jgi:hypothetical protein